MPIDEAALKAALTKLADDEHTAAVAATVPSTNYSTSKKVAQVRGDSMLKREADFRALAATITDPVTPPVEPPVTPPSTAKPSAPTMTVAVSGSTATMTIITKAGELVTGVCTFMDGVKQSWGRINADSSASMGPVTVTRMQDLGTSSHVLAANAYNDNGEGPLCPDQTVAPATTPPVTPPSTGTVGLRGIFPYDHQQSTWISLAGQLNLPTPTAANPAMIILHLRRDQDWATSESIWFTGIWPKGQPQYRKVITVPGFPDKVGGSLGAAGNGDYDSHYRTICQNIASAYPNEEIWIRYMHEANCCYNHKASANPGGYKAAWGHFTPIARACIPGVKVIFCPIYGNGDIAIEDIEPLASLYDGYGMDYYGSAYDYTSFRTASHGLNWLGDRAKAQGKFCGLFEFGPGRWGSPYQAQSMPDDAKFMYTVYDWAKQYGAHVVSYCDNTQSSGGVDSYLPDFPNNLYAWQHSFGTALPRYANA